MLRCLLAAPLVAGERKRTHLERIHVGPVVVLLNIHQQRARRNLGAGKIQCFITGGGRIGNRRVGFVIDVRTSGVHRGDGVKLCRIGGRVAIDANLPTGVLPGWRG